MVMNSEFLHFSAVIFLLGVNIGLTEGNRLKLVDAYGDEVLVNNYETKKFIQVAPSPDLQNASFQVSHFVSYNGRDWINDIRNQEYKANAQFVAGYNAYEITLFGRTKTILAKYRLHYSLCPDTHDICQKVILKDQEFFKHPNQKFCLIHFNHSSRTTDAKHDLTTNLTVEFGTKSLLAQLCKVYDPKLVACSNIDCNTDRFEYSVCKIYGNGDRPLYIVTTNTCKNHMIHFWNHGAPLFLGEYHLMSELAQLKIVCAGKTQKAEICQKRYKEKICLEAQTSYKCNQNVPIDPVSYDRLFVSKLSANLNNQSSTYIFVVNLVKPQVKLEESGNCEVTCRITNIKSSTGHFRFKFTIYDEVSTISTDYTTSMNSSVNIFKNNDAYVCSAEIRFRVCSPFGEFYTVGYSSKLLVSRCERLLISETVKKSTFYPATGIVCVGAITIIWAICILVLLILRKTIPFILNWLSQREPKK